MDNKNDKRLHLAVLQLLKKNGDISQISGGIFTYTDIANVLLYFKINGIARDIQGEIELTKIGEIYLKELISEMKIHPFISPQYKYFSRKMKIDEVYLKNRDLPH